MRKTLIVLVIFAMSFVRVPSARADLFGGDVLLLIQVAANTLETTIRLSELLGAAEQTIEMQRAWQRGINDRLTRLDAIHRVVQRRAWQGVSQPDRILSRIQEIFDLLPKDLGEGRRAHLDLVTVDGLHMAEGLDSYGERLSDISDSLASQALTASPMRAQQLSAQAAAAQLAAEGQRQRNEGQSLRLLSTLVAQKNYQDKVRAKVQEQQMSELTDALGQSAFRLYPAVRGL